MTESLDELYQQWEFWKAEEEAATLKRRIVEDKIKTIANIGDEEEGTNTLENDEFVVKIVGRIDRKVDGDKAQEIAMELGLEDHLSSLFRWKPELNMSAWKAADESITKPFAAAITAKPNRASFKITRKEI